MTNIKIFRSKDEQWQFKVVENDGIMLLISETYRSKRSRNVGINSVRKNSQVLEMYEEKIAKTKPSKPPKYYFILKAKNGECIGTSRMFATEVLRGLGIIALKKILQ